MTPEQEARQAAEARHIVEHELFVQAKADFEERLKQARRQAPIVATELHTRLILLEQAGEQFFEFFEMLVKDGRLAEHGMNLDKVRQRAIDDRLAAWLQNGRNSF